MNAYELADELDALFTKADWEEIPNVVAMLRQQADRIAELEKEVKSVTEQGENFWQQLCELKAHPVKQLSDEEIANIWAEHTKIAGTYDVKDIIFPFARAIIKEITE